ncbi:barstar family protein [Actinacidiphila acidipaludis]|uniref:barstar family protein n=1 Tax=Actinacidiphila acidipaludis TaxID=2873382 RepID=UPI0027E05031|nr:barstar family protein [Streptomyces acidipaludis]
MWLVPEEEQPAPTEELDAWRLEDAVSLGRHPGTDSLLLTGLDDFLGPPDGHGGRVRIHDERRWLGSCREVARVLPPENPPRTLVLRGLAPSDRLLSALRVGTRRARDLDQCRLEIRDDHDGLVADLLVRPAVQAWQPSAHGRDLIDVALTGSLPPMVPDHVRLLWERWFGGPPGALGEWTALGTRERWAWLDLVREHGCRTARTPRPPGSAVVLDGRQVTDEPSLYLALGEAVNGPGGYFGGCTAALADCLRGSFGWTPPGTLVWRDSATARRHLSQRLAAEGQTYGLFAGILEILAEGGMRVTLA